MLNNNSSYMASSSLRFFCSKIPHTYIWDSPSNLGVSNGRNMLIEKTQEPWLFFVDNDIQICTPDWLPVLSHYIESNPQVEVFIPRLFNVHDKCYVPHLLMRIENNHVETQIAEQLTSNMFPGGAAIVSRQLFNRLGLYDNEMKIGLEDWELALRAILSGNPIKTMSIKNILLVHDHRKTQDEETKKAILIRYNEQIINNSYQRLITKHGVTWNHNYSSWLSEQLGRMLTLPDDKPKLSLFGKKTRHLPTRCNLHVLKEKPSEWSDFEKNFPDDKISTGMTSATIKKILEVYPNLYSFHVLAGKQDPLLCSHINEILDYVKSCGKSIGINTNGAYADKLLSLHYEPNYISFHLYGWNVNSTIEQCGLDIFKTVMKNYLELKEKCSNIGFSYTLCKNNYQNLDEILDLCDKLQPAFLHLNNYLPCNLLPEQITKVITVNDSSVIENIEKAIHNRPYTVNPPKYLSTNHPLVGSTPTCRSYKKVISIDEAGNISGCNGPVFPNNFTGNIFNDKDPFNTLEMCRLRNLTFNRLYPHPECLYCCNKII